MTYKVLIFDLDGTLINSLPYHFLAFKDLMLEHRIKTADSHLRRLIGISTADILKELKKRYKFKENVQDMREERRFHYFKYLGKRNIVFPGIRKVLEKLHLNYKLGIATGSSKIILIHSTDKEFQELFDLVVTINDVKRGKPYPNQFILVAKKFHVNPKKCLVVGDSIYDGMAAKHCGMDFIGVTTGYTKRSKLIRYGAVKVIDSVKELVDVLR